MLENIFENYARKLAKTISINDSSREKNIEHTTRRMLKQNKIMTYSEI